MGSQDDLRETTRLASSSALLQVPARGSWGRTEGRQGARAGPATRPLLPPPRASAGAGLRFCPGRSRVVPPKRGRRGGGGRRDQPQRARLGFREGLARQTRCPRVLPAARLLLLCLQAGGRAKDRHVARSRVSLKPRPPHSRTRLHSWKMGVRLCEQLQASCPTRRALTLGHTHTSNVNTHFPPSRVLSCFQ